MKAKVTPSRHPLRVGMISLCLLWMALCCAGAPSSAPSPESAESLMSRILTQREALDRETRTDARPSNSEQLGALRMRLANQARQLGKLSTAFYRAYPSNELCFQAMQSGIYSRALLGMVSRADSAVLWNTAEGISNCRSVSTLMKNDSLSLERATHLHRILQESFTDAIVATLPLQPDNDIGAVRFAERAAPAAGKRLTQALLGSPFLSASARSAANRILDRSVAIGQPVRLKFTALGGSNVDLMTLRGKVVLVDFWATDCPPCMAQFPELKELHERFTALGLVILGISCDSDPKHTERVLQQMKISWPNFTSEKGLSNEHCMAFGVSGIPDCFLIDREGILREAGATENFESKIKYLLDLPGPNTP